MRRHTLCPQLCLSDLGGSQGNEVQNVNPNLAMAAYLAKLALVAPKPLVDNGGVKSQGTSFRDKLDAERRALAAVRTARRQAKRKALRDAESEDRRLMRLEGERDRSASARYQPPPPLSIVYPSYAAAICVCVYASMPAMLNLRSTGRSGSRENEIGVPLHGTSHLHPRLVSGRVSPSHRRCHRRRRCLPCLRVCSQETLLGNV